MCARSWALGTLLLLASPHLSAVEWQRANGPTGAYIQAVAVHPANPRILLAGTTELFRTEDGGDSWTRVQLPTDLTELSVCGLAFSPADPDTVYCNCNVGMMVSRDAGRTWERRAFWKRIVMCNPIVADPFDVDRVYMTLGSMVFPGSLPLRISRDGGKTFEASVLPEERHVSQIHPDPHHRGVLLALGYPPEDNADGVELLLSRDYGSSWTQIPAAPEWQGKAIAWCNLDPENDRLLCAAVSTARTRELSYWFTYDDGRTWELLYEEGAGIADTPAMRKKLAATFPPRMDLPHLRNRDLTNLIVAPSNPRTVYYISSNEDLMRTLDGGETWECISGTLNFHTVERVIPHPKRAGSAFCHAGRQGGHGPHRCASNKGGYAVRLQLFCGLALRRRRRDVGEGHGVCRRCLCHGDV
jgi:hypothetical protein